MLQVHGSSRWAFTNMEKEDEEKEEEDEDVDEDVDEDDGKGAVSASASAATAKRRRLPLRNVMQRAVFCGENFWGWCSAGGVGGIFTARRSSSTLT